MTERYNLVDNGYLLYIEDTTLTEDKHEGHMDELYQLCRKLNEYDKENQKLKTKICNLTEDRDYYKTKSSSLETGLIKAENENNKLKKLLDLISNIDSIVYERDSVKELIRDEIRGLDTVSYDCGSAWNDYVILSEWFREHYGEDWEE